MKNNLKYIKEGSKLACPSCKKYVYEMKVDFFIGQTLSARHIKSCKEGVELLDGQIINCPFCHYSFLGEEHLDFKSWEQPHGKD